MYTCLFLRDRRMVKCERHGRQTQSEVAQNLYKLQTGSFLCGMPVEMPVDVLYYCQIVAAWAGADGCSRCENSAYLFTVGLSTWQLYRSISLC